MQARVPSDPDGAGPIPAGQGPAGQEQVGRTPTARVGPTLDGRWGWGCSQNGGGRGPRGPAIGQGSLDECNKPSDLETFQVTRKRARF